MHKIGGNERKQFTSRMAQLCSANWTRVALYDKVNEILYWPIAKMVVSKMTHKKHLGIGYQNGLWQLSETALRVPCP